ncbi:Ig-like domain-containing protein [Longimicrobium sp.]|uniref:Ig-like domain-containing protein n=1 Tax=Longimicrobium sp. TaxID=2029185 RepID=UPI003B3B644A
MRINPRPLPFAGLLVLGAAVFAAACSDSDPLLRDKQAPALAPSAAYLRCAADVRAGTVTCREVSPVASAGGASAAHYIYFQSAPHALVVQNDYVATSTDISFDLRVVNLVPQAIGTDDGVTLHSRGVRVFFWSNPVVTDGGGSISIAEPTASGSFTGSNQKYHQWNEIIQSQDTSVAEKHYVFNITGTVNAFEFTLGISTNMQWAAITSASAATASVAVSSTVDLDAWRLNSLGDTMAISSITWASDNTGVATVNSTSGVVTGVSAGTANVIASQSGSRSDTVVVTVN